MKHLRARNLHRLLLLLALPVLVVSLGCMAAQRLAYNFVFPTTPTPCSGEGCLDACLERISRMLETSPLESIDNKYYREGANINIDLYPVDGDQLGEPMRLWVPDEFLPYQEDTSAHYRIWSFFTDVIPLNLRKELDRMMIYTDGEGVGSAGWVEPTEYGSEGWTIGFDVLDSIDPFSLTFILVHEVGHLITLNSSQIPPYDFSLKGTPTPAVCNQYLTWDGCSTETSYINRFYQTFWRDLRKEWAEIDKVNDEDEREALLQEFYDRHQQEFVSDYAVTNPQEDLAESWTGFVLEPRPTGNEIADRKVLFFYDYPELVEARHEIIDGLCSYAP